jgi:hypothetical protein
LHRLKPRRCGSIEPLTLSGDGITCLHSGYRCNHVEVADLEMAARQRTVTCAIVATRSHKRHGAPTLLSADARNWREVDRAPTRGQAVLRDFQWRCQIRCYSLPAGKFSAPLGRAPGIRPIPGEIPAAGPPHCSEPAPGIRQCRLARPFEKRPRRHNRISVYNINVTISRAVSGDVGRHRAGLSILDRGTRIERQDRAPLQVSKQTVGEYSVGWHECVGCV